MAKARSGRADALPAAEAFELATIDGARALGIDADVGSLEVGKKADVCVVGQSGLHQLPGGDPYSRLVYATTPADVRHVVCDGQVLVEDATLRTLDAAAVARAAREQGTQVAARAGLSR